MSRYGEGPSAGSVVGLLAIPLLLILIVGVLLSLHTVDSGYVGVPVTFGKAGADLREPGITFAAPLITGVVQMPVKTQVMDSPNIVALTGKSEGQTVTVHAIFYYRITDAHKVYTALGPDAYQSFVNTKSRGAIYEVVGQYSAQDLYTDRDAVATPALSRLNKDLEQYGLYCDSITISGISLPEKLKASIEEKQAMEQDIQKKAYEVKVAEMEADRKRAEARGIADANGIIAGSLSENYLKWYWIENVANGENTIYVPSNGGYPVLTAAV